MVNGFQLLGANMLSLFTAMKKSHFKKEAIHSLKKKVKMMQPEVITLQVELGTCQC
jgi:hypothetical protein